MHAIYINLDRRSDRRAEIETELSKTPLVYERFTAVDRPDNPPIGCTQSHLEALKFARNRGYESVIIFEDDFQFLVGPATFNRILANVPTDYDVVMFGYNIVQSEPYNEMFGRVLEAQTASAYLVHSRFYDTLIANLEEGLSRFILNPSYHWLYINDQYWKRLQPGARWYYTLDRTGKQRPSYSDLAREFVDYGK
jgi:hypothetical protein